MSQKLFGLMGLERGAAVSFDPEPLMKCGILQVQGAPLNLTGRGVVLGFLDTGIRYDEEVFRNPDGSTRILGIWDQRSRVETTGGVSLWNRVYKGADPGCTAKRKASADRTKL